MTRGPTGSAFVAKATEMLVGCGLEAPEGMLYEAADLQWWWAGGAFAVEGDQVLLEDAAGRTIAWIAFDSGANGALECDTAWLPSAASRELYERVLAALEQRSRGPATLGVHARDCAWKAMLTEWGWQPSDERLVQWSWQRQAIVAPDLSPEFAFQSPDELTRDPGMHPLAKRNGADIARRLNRCSLYDPTLDLQIRHVPSGDIAAYGLCWFEPRTRVALFEPVRVETPFHRRGLGAGLMREGLRRLIGRGVERVKVSHYESNTAAGALYQHVGFRTLFHQEIWRRESW